MPEDLLLWVDLETTGSEVEKGDEIIEFAAILTTLDLDELSSHETVIMPRALGLGRMMLHPVVRRMHETNGLLEELLENDYPFVGQAERFILQWLDLEFSKMTEKPKLVLAGSGVAHFDRKFIDKYMPQLARRLRYYTLDIGVVRRAHRWWLGEDLSTANDGKTHRAMDDIRCHLAEAREFKSCWLSWRADARVVDQQRLV